MLKIIVNPAAGGGKTKDVWPDIERRIKKLGMDYSFVFTAGIGDAANLAKVAVKESLKKIFVVGGDGTCNEVVNGIDLKQTTVGIIPTGIGNDFAKMIGIKNIADGLIALQHQNQKLIDLGKIGRRYFVNNLGIGFAACVARQKKKLKYFKGNLVYRVSVLAVLCGFKAFGLEVKADGISFRDKIMDISIGNGQFHGGCFKLTPQAVLNDGFLDICIIKKINKIKFLFNIPKALKGEHTCLKEVVYFKTKKILIKAESPLFVHLDGEVLSEPIEELEIEVLPSSLEVFVV